MREPIGVLLAAGRGQRLQPLTLVRPKPLVPLHGIPLLDFGLRQMARAGCRLVAVNGHHLAEMLKAWLERRQAEHPELEIRFFAEPALLGVGGGLARMARELPPGPLIVQNGDVLHDAELGRLLELARLEEGGAALVLGGRPHVVEAAGGQVLGLRDTTRSTHGFTGVHFWSEEARARLCGWRDADLVPFLQAELAAGRALRALPLAGEEGEAHWVDLGHLSHYLPLHAALWARPAYRRLLERLELQGAWDPVRRVSLGRGSQLPESAVDCVAWDEVRWEGAAARSIFLDGVRGKGSTKGEIIF